MIGRPTRPFNQGRSVYGMRVLGLDEVTELTAVGDVGGDEIIVEIRQADCERPAVAGLDPDQSVQLLADGRHLAMHRAAGTAIFFGPPLAPNLLAHPYLGPVAATFNRWGGREAFHAGAFVAGARAWVVVGARTAGKSSLLAALAARGLPVLSDDVLITDGASAFAGPRCIDLREAIPGSSLPTVPARLDTRLRVPLPAVARRVALGGWLFLGWGAESLTAVGPEQLLGRLAYQRAARTLASDPLVLLRLATLPAWDLTRPRDWAALPDTLETLLDAIAATSSQRNAA